MVNRRAPFLPRPWHTWNGERGSRKPYRFIDGTHEDAPPAALPGKVTAIRERVERRIVEALTSEDPEL